NANGVINKIAISEVDKKRNELLRSYPDAVAFSNRYQVTDELAARLRQQAVTDDVEWDEDQFLKSRPLILLQLKALIARDLYDSSAFFRIINEENEIFREGLRIISDGQRYEGLLRGVGSNFAHTSRQSHP
ncbi:MAG: peptidase S41, partial [Proteiniphilum sp.]|nr:peptidase S41 [Proteiniphilum sp.]MDD4159310.1 peptidase S41 [Proteiniphilum sp.]